MIVSKIRAARRIEWMSPVRTSRGGGDLLFVVGGTIGLLASSATALYVLRRYRLAQPDVDEAPSWTWAREVAWLGRQCYTSLTHNKDRTSLTSSIPQHTGSRDATNPDADVVPAVNPESAHRLRENLELIHGVLAFWFDHDSIDGAQKKLWMISHQNVTLRNQVDADIATRYGRILIDVSTSNLWSEWCHDTAYGTHGILAAIVVLDQFSRHVHRFVQHYRQRADHDGGTTLDASLWTLLDQTLPEQSTLDRLAYQTALLLERSSSQPLGTDEAKRPRHDTSHNLWTIPMRIFALMPHRHVSTLDSVEWTRRAIEELERYQSQCGTMVAAFRKATHRRLAVLHDQTRRTGRDTNGSVESIDSAERHSMDTEFDDILECGPFRADLTHASDHVVHRTIRDFMTSVGIHPHDTASHSSTAPMVKPKVPIVVSLSGGVDSMVIAAVLAHLKQECGYSQLHIVAAHIDYANRPESHAESTFVQQYCRDYWTGAVDCTVRRIDEVTRGITARDDYERMARDIRYSFYRDTVQGCRAACHPGADASGGAVPTKDVGVVLGHHRGDLRENVLSNAHKGSGPLDLSGMTVTSFNDGVTLYRPLLSLEKTAIFDYAHKYGVPYFKDTTPHWSTRGKLRNKLVPLLEEIYGEGSMNNLSNLAVESDACRALMQKLLIQPFMDDIVYQPMGMYFPTAPWKDQGTFFWNIVLREALHSAGLGMFTDKSVESFMKRACCRDSDIREGWLQCRKDYAVYLRSDGHIFVFYPRTFPWHKNDYYTVTLGQAVPYGLDHAVMVGPWTVTAVVLPEESQQTPSDVTSLLDQKAIASMESFMQGTVEYYLRVPVYPSDGKWLPRPLVFATFVKQNRPRAWKNVDTKIQETLPLLGNDVTASQALDDMRRQLGSEADASACCVKVTLRVTEVERR